MADSPSSSPSLPPEKNSVPAQHADDVWPIGKRSAYMACVVAFLLGAFDLIDRQIMASLFPYIKAEYALTDAQLGLLMTVLNISISVMVLPSAYFIDKWSRTKMLCIMGVIWSLATGACAIAGTYGHLLIARFMCGAGEAGYNPAAQSLLAASFPRRLRTTAVGLAQFGMALGGPLGLIIGAYIATHWGWRHAFGVVAIPGLIISFLALGLKDFKTVKDENSREKKVPYPVILGELMRTPTLLCQFIAAAIILFGASMLQTWMPSYFVRVAKLPITTASSIAALNFVFSAASIALAGPFMDWARRKRANIVPVWLCFCMTLSMLSRFYVYGLAEPGSIMQLVVMYGASLICGTMGTVGAAMVVDLSHPAHRASAISLMILIQNLVGYAFGPLVTGWLSDMFDLRTAILIGSSFSVIGIIAYGIAIFTYARDRAKVSNVTTVF